MKTNLSTLRNNFAIIVFAAFSTILFSSCAKENPGYAEIPSARLMAYNLASDMDQVAFTIGTAPISNVLGYTEHTVNYVPVEAGDRQVGAFNTNGGAVLASQTAAFTADAQYSTFLIGSNGNYQTIISLDDNGRSNRTSGETLVRYINAISDNSATANVSIAGQTETAAFGAVSDFRAVDPGMTTVEISTDNYDVQQTVNLEQGKMYTVMFVGESGSTNPMRAPKAKLIVNKTTN